MSHATWSLVRDEIPCQAKGEIQVKGSHHPVRVYGVMPRQPERSSTAGEIEAG